MAPISEEQIALRSYRMWEREGRPEGRHLEHWFRARAELEAEDAPASTNGQLARGTKGLSQSEQFLRILRAG